MRGITRTTRTVGTNWHRRLSASVVVLSLLLLGFNSDAMGAPAKAETETKDDLSASPEDVKWFTEARFGLFVHWGPGCMTKQQISWCRRGDQKRSDGNTGWKNAPVPAEEYDNLYRQFNPTEFDAREWAQLVIDAGMKYMVFTTKHHDGFCMFDTKLTDYNIMNSPIKRDLTAELAKAFHEAGVRLGFYYSQPDWYRSDYRSENHDKYLDYMRGQLHELCSNYGKVSVIWFDGSKNEPEQWDAFNIVKMMRGLQPGILINDRNGLPGDFATCEQKLGRFRTDRPWECCIVIEAPGGLWSWRPNVQPRSLRECILMLVECAGGDGNFLLNVGPSPTGKIEPDQAARLREVGQWMRKYGDSVYATRGGPFMPGQWGASTYKGNTIYVHVSNWNEVGDRVKVSLPAIKPKIVSHSVLTGGKAAVTQSPSGIEISMAAADRAEINTVVALQLDGPAADIEPRPWELESIAQDKKATASSIGAATSKYSYEPAKALDGHVGTAWFSTRGAKAHWLEVDLGEPTTVDRVLIHEYLKYRGQVQQFTIEYKDGDQWRTCASGSEMGVKRMLQFEPVTARYIRLNILKARSTPKIAEFQIFSPIR